MTRLKSYLSLALLLSATLALLSLTALLLRANWLLEESRLLVVDARTTISTWNRTSQVFAGIVDRKAAKIEQIITDSEAITTDVRRAVKVQRQEWESPEYIRWRKDGFRFGEQATIALAKLTPKLEDGVDNLNAFVGRLDVSVNDKLVPEMTSLMATLNVQVEKIGVSASATFDEIAKLVAKGDLTFEAANKVLASPHWEEILKDMAGSMSHVEASLRPVPGIVRTAEKWQKPAILAGLIATLARALIP